MEIIPFFEPQSSTWTYLVGDEASGEAAVIDPVWVFDPVRGVAERAFIDQVLERASQQGWRISWVLETHVHADHMSAGGLVRDETGARIGIGRRISEVQHSFARIYNLPELETADQAFDRLLGEGDQVSLGTLTVRVMETPGHTPDSVTYLAEDAAFVGDTLFAPALGTARCDFPGGSARELFGSIRRLHELPGATRLFLCHDYPGPDADPTMMITVEESRRDNIHLGQGATLEHYVALREGRDANLGLPRLILPAIQVNLLGGRPPAPEANGVSYLKIPFNTSIRKLVELTGHG